MSKTLRDLRIEKGVYQHDVAADIGASVPAYSSWETGKTNPEPPMLPKLAGYFKMPVTKIREALVATQRQAARVALAASQKD